MIVLDARVVAAALHRTDRRHRAAVTLMSHAADELVIHPVNLAEILVLAERSGKGADLQRDLRSWGIDARPSSGGEAMRLAHVRVRTGARMADCCTLALALELRAPVATFDRRLAAAAGALRVGVHRGRE